MNKNQYLAFKKKISSFKREDLIELAIVLKALMIAFKRFGKLLNSPLVTSQVQKGELNEIIGFLRKYDGLDKETVLKLLKIVEQQIGEDYYVEIKAFPTVLKKILEVASDSIAKHKVIDLEEMTSLGLKVKASEKIYNRDLDRDLKKLLGESL